MRAPIASSASRWVPIVRRAGKSPPGGAICARPSRASSGPSSSTDPRSRPTSVRSGSQSGCRHSGSSASSCRCPRPRRRCRAAAVPSPRRRRCAARWSGRTRRRSADTLREAAVPRSCCLRRQPYPRGGFHLQSASVDMRCSRHGPRDRLYGCVRYSTGSLPSNPTNTGSGLSATPNRSSTRRLMVVASRSTSRGRRAATVHERQRMLASKSPTAPSTNPVRIPRARSATRPESSPIRRASGTWRSAAARHADIVALRVADTTGFMKNEPTLRLSGSAASTTMPFRLRMAITLSRTSNTVGFSIPARDRVFLHVRIRHRGPAPDADGTSRRRR